MPWVGHKVEQNTNCNTSCLSQPKDLRQGNLILVVLHMYYFEWSYISAKHDDPLVMLTNESELCIWISNFQEWLSMAWATSEPLITSWESCSPIGWLKTRSDLEHDIFWSIDHWGDDTKPQEHFEIIDHLWNCIFVSRSHSVS